MGKYLLLWEMDQTRIPVDPKERETIWGPLMDMVKQDIEKGIFKDWGSFVGETKGYTIAEGTEEEIENMVKQYIPFVQFEVHPIAVDEGIKALSK